LVNWRVESDASGQVVSSGFVREDVTSVGGGAVYPGTGLSVGTAQEALEALEGEVFFVVAEASRIPPYDRLL
jgi:hypothetical protein